MPTEDRLGQGLVYVCDDGLQLARAAERQQCEACRRWIRWGRLHWRHPRYPGKMYHLDCWSSRVDISFRSTIVNLGKKEGRCSHCRGRLTGPSVIQVHLTCYPLGSVAKSVPVHQSCAGILGAKGQVRRTERDVRCASCGSQIRRGREATWISMLIEGEQYYDLQTFHASCPAEVRERQVLAVSESPSSYDAFYLRLPGSYGSGRRR